MGCECYTGNDLLITKVVSRLNESTPIVSKFLKNLLSLSVFIQLLPVLALHCCVGFPLVALCRLLIEGGALIAGHGLRAHRLRVSRLPGPGAQAQ